MFGFTGVIYAQTVSEIVTTVLAFVLFQGLVAKELQD